MELEKRFLKRVSPSQKVPSKSGDGVQVNEIEMKAES